MKYGARKPSMKKSISARTKGRATRAVKRATNPFYGKKGAGWIKNPEKAAYNKLYHATTFSVFSLFSGHKGKKKDGPIVTGISYIIVFFIFAGALQLILPSLGSVLVNLLLIIGAVVFVLLLIKLLSSRPSGPTIEDLLLAERIKRVLDKVPDDAIIYLGDYSEREWIIALRDDQADIIDTRTREVTSYKRIPGINNSFSLEHGDSSLKFIITENEDSIIMGQYDFDRVQKKDLEEMAEIVVE